MIPSFNSLDWHDAVILEIQVDRERPGEDDRVVMRLVWPDSKRGRITFTRCYAFEASLNFGVIAEETIRSAMETKDDLKLTSLRQKWDRMNVSLPSLACFRFETNSTASIISIYAERWELSDAD